MYSSSRHMDITDTQSDQETELVEECFLLGRIEGREIDSLGVALRVTEVAPSNSGIYDGHSSASLDDEGRWKIPLSHFTSKKHGVDDKLQNKRIRSYYKAQDRLIESFEELQLEINDAMLDSNDVNVLQKKALFYARLTFGVNCLLLIAKAVASTLSGSIAIISSLVDSIVDLASGIILWWATKAVKKRDPYIYPQGRTKLEPVAITILSVLMAAASLQLTRESITKIISISSGTAGLPVVDIPVFAIAGGTVGAKLVLWLLCRRIPSPSVQTLALDHRNDVCSNAVAIACGYVGSIEMKKLTGISGLSYVDPAGAILISLYIVYNWWQTGAEQIRLLTGYTARPEFLSKLTWICVNHHKKILHIDTVRAFHFGNNFLVEVDIVLPEAMSMKEAHDIGEPLQLKLEALPEVERAFVHLDYEYTHNPKSEHKIV
ncbi:metal tolerance protein 9-like isoform X3 [Haliotis rufescens]|uniref:metal tolerance protein 9-like isoform X3 n=1 Tax=Haliotis rufescens TaxID=6454 RepID=UPI00201F429B|nr:metal tolerance protein 9-like isoform X3 [Haliotis rufescens]